MKTCTKCGERKALTDFHRDARRKDGYRSRCRVCYSRYYSAWREENLEQEAAKKRRWYEENRERKAANDKRWNEENRDRKNAINARRRARKKEAELDWATEVQKEAVAAKYALREHYTSTTGIEHHVDHIWPLKGFPTVFEDFDEKDIDFDLLPEHILILWEGAFRGLHVADNLQVIPATDNLSKSNKRPVDEDGNERPACKWSKTEYDY